VSEWVPGNDTKYSYDVEAQIGSGLSVKEEPKWALNADWCGNPILALSSPRLPEPQILISLRFGLNTRVLERPLGTNNSPRLAQVNTCCNSNSDTTEGSGLCAANGPLQRLGGHDYTASLFRHGYLRHLTSGTQAIMVVSKHRT
jgi:hypothetical protein